MPQKMKALLRTTPILSHFERHSRFWGQINSNSKSFVAKKGSALLKRLNRATRRRTLQANECGFPMYTAPKEKGPGTPFDLPEAGFYDRGSATADRNSHARFTKLSGDAHKLPTEMTDLLLGKFLETAILPYYLTESSVGHTLPRTGT